jgi:hypothetical protein
MPAVGFYAGGYVLGQLLLIGVKLCDTIMARGLSVCGALGEHPLKLDRRVYLELVD